ncbi:hypothetical protein [Ruminiclostridium cellobioparum]|uniref:SipW-cognate class signal peptide n=1 Tax=Ruminiclostridium cellobioparum subsp. termitidis CT1112 TaxID=1195236 RepID=S0FR94_RUMCE|nr:hypothetical protein [Ruminiclostridium cellobioparum]EMS72876.1 hypothetical protein CTER_1177 [Ruminiclostridium cellobioparum subsp. termitidis CT1112]
MKKLKRICISMGIFCLISTMLFSVAFAQSIDSNTSRGNIIINDSQSTDSKLATSDSKVTPLDVVIGGTCELILVPIGNLYCDADWTVASTMALSRVSPVVTWGDGTKQTTTVYGGILLKLYGSFQRRFPAPITTNATLTGTALLNNEYTATLAPYTPPASVNVYR